MASLPHTFLMRIKSSEKIVLGAQKDVSVCMLYVCHVRGEIHWY